MILVVALLAGIGLTCILYRRTAIGLALGIQIMVLSASLLFVLAGAADSKTAANGQIAGLWVLMFGLVIGVSACAVALRLFYLRKRASLEDVRTLRH